LLAVALFLSGIERRWAVTGVRRVSLGLLLAGILAVGVLDQTSSANVPPYGSIAESYRSDGQFVRRIEQRIGARGSVFQLPYVPFPDGGVVRRITDYDLVRGYLHSNSLRWSFGAMVGRPEDWQAELAARPATLQVEAAAVAGFDGVYIDRFGYADAARSLERLLRTLTGEPPLASADERLAFFDLRGLRRRLEQRHTANELGALRRATLEPLTMTWTGFGDVEWSAGREWRPFASNAALVVTNPSRVTRRALVEAVLADRNEAGREVTLRYPDRSNRRVRPTRAGSRVGHVVELAPGANVIGVEVGGARRAIGDATPLRAQVSVLDEGFWPFARPRAANRRSG
jgi:phosphoglycerol transferase